MIKGRPNYYITPTHDFTQYTKDCEKKYWSKETAFDWTQSVLLNLKKRLENLNLKDFSKIAFMTLPMIEESIIQKINQIKKAKLPLEEDALKDIGECIPYNKTAFKEALNIQSPLKQLQISVLKLKDQIEIYQSELVDLEEQKRLGLIRDGVKVKHIQTEEERKEQANDLTKLNNKIAQAKIKYKALKTQSKIDSNQIKAKIQEELNSIEQQILDDLNSTKELIQQIVKSKEIPQSNNELSQIKDLILKRQLRGLKDIANHALVVEQSAIAPLTMGIIHYKRHREIQEALTTFINDEAKHSATFRRFLVEKLEAKEFISDKLIKGADRYMWLARFMPSAGMFLAVIVEAIGAAYLEFFGEEKYMPDVLFCSICKTISIQDERRHMDLCVAMYNELFRKGTRWERFRNEMSLKVVMKSVYGDKDDDHQLIQAFQAFGVESDTLYNHIVSRLSEQLARISMYIEPDKLLEIIGRK